jgi:RecA-family ATPase
MNLPAEALVDELGRKLAKIATAKGKDRLMTARQLQAEPYDDVEFLVQDVLPMGLTVLMGAPKQGKSWLLLLLAEVLSSGVGKFLWKNAKTCPVLIYSLEDGFRICKNRLGILQSRWSENLFIKEKAYGASNILQDIELTKARLVIIDTLGAYADMENSNSYDETTRKIRELKQIASTCDVAIVCAHHTRKPSKEAVTDWTQEGLGSQGIVGAADCVMSLQRKRGEDRARLNITGRAVADCWMSLKFLGGYWERYREEAAQ